MDYQKYIPAIAIISIAAIAIKKLSDGGATQIINRGVDFTRNDSQLINRDPARVSAFGTLASVALGQQNIESKRDVTFAQIEAEKIRAGSALDTLRYRTDAEVEIARINAASRAYDRDLQTRAIDRMNDYAAAANRRQQNNQLLNSILGALGSLAQRAQGATRGSGSSSGGDSLPRVARRPTIPEPRVTYRTPPFTPEYPTFNPNFDFRLPSSGSGFDLLPQDNPNFLDYFSPGLYDPMVEGPFFGGGDLTAVYDDSGFWSLPDDFGGFGYGAFDYTNPFGGGFGYDPQDFGNPLGGYYGDDDYDFYGFDFD